MCVCVYIYIYIYIRKKLEINPTVCTQIWNGTLPTEIECFTTF